MYRHTPDLWQSLASSGKKIFLINVDGLLNIYLEGKLNLFPLTIHKNQLQINCIMWEVTQSVYRVTVGSSASACFFSWPCWNTVSTLPCNQASCMVFPAVLNSSWDLERPQALRKVFRLLPKTLRETSPGPESSSSSFSHQTLHSATLVWTPLGRTSLSLIVHQETGDWSPFCEWDPLKNALDW